MLKSLQHPITTPCPGEVETHPYSPPTPCHAQLLRQWARPALHLTHPEILLAVSREGCAGLGWAGKGASREESARSRAPSGRLQDRSLARKRGRGGAQRRARRGARSSGRRTLGARHRHHGRGQPGVLGLLRPQPQLRGALRVPAARRGRLARLLLRLRRPQVLLQRAGQLLPLQAQLHVEPQVGARGADRAGGPDAEDPEHHPGRSSLAGLGAPRGSRDPPWLGRLGLGAPGTNSTPRAAPGTREGRGTERIAAPGASPLWVHHTPAPGSTSLPSIPAIRTRIPPAALRVEALKKPTT